MTNDEMRDHIFELLGSSFFLKWKERHQVCAFRKLLTLNCHSSCHFKRGLFFHHHYELLFASLFHMVKGALKKDLDMHLVSHVEPFLLSVFSPMFHPQ